MLEYLPRRKKKGRLLSVIIIVSVTGAAGAFFYNYGDLLYYKYIDTSGIFLLQNRDEQLRKTLISGTESPDFPKFYPYLKDSLTMTSNLEKKFPAHPGVYYYHGLFRFYDFLIRVPLTPDSLRVLAGRRFLPSDRKIPDLPELDTVMTAREIAHFMRKATALGLSGDQLHVAQLAAAAGDLFYTGRTDPALLDNLKDISEKSVPPELLPALRWMNIVLLVIHGKTAELSSYLKALEAPDAVKAAKSPYFDNDFLLNQTEKDLLTAYANLYSGNYIPALLTARTIRILPGAEPKYKTEARIIEAEVFLVQRGPVVALQLYQEADRETSGSDFFIQDRIRYLEGILKH